MRKVRKIMKKGKSGIRGVSRSTPGLHLMKDMKRKNGRITNGVKQQASNLAKRGMRFVLGSSNQGSTDLGRGVTKR